VLLISRQSANNRVGRRRVEAGDRRASAGVLLKRQHDWVDYFTADCLCSVLDSTASRAHSPDHSHLPSPDHDFNVLCVE